MGHALAGNEWHRTSPSSGGKGPVTFITAHASDERARSEAASDWNVADLTKSFREDEPGPVEAL